MRIYIYTYIYTHVYTWTPRTSLTRRFCALFKVCDYHIYISIYMYIYIQKKLYIKTAAKEAAFLPVKSS